MNIEVPEQVWLSGTVPVSVCIDVATKDVSKVVVGDEAFEYDEEQEPAYSFETVAVARAIADQVDWPGWEFGW